MLEVLRRTLQKLERPPTLEGGPGVMPFGLPDLDSVLGGGIARGALHEIAALSEAHIAAATGLALGLTGSAHRRTVVWIAEDMAHAENGLMCGPGLDAFGLCPERLITVAISRRRDLFWAMEEALHCRAAGVVIGEVRGGMIDPVALRRLSFAAAAHGAPALLLRNAPACDASTAATRWIVRAASSIENFGPGPPRFDIQLVRNRRGPLGHWTLEWSDTDGCFSLASTHAEPMARPAVHRPARKIA